MKKGLFFGLIIMSFAGCMKTNVRPNPALTGTTPTTPTTTTGEPKAGSKWTYKLTGYNESGAVTGTVNVEFTSKDTIVGGSVWLLLTNAAFGQRSAIQKRADGWWWAPLPNTTPSLWYKTMAAANDQYLMSISDGTTDTAKVNTLSTAVTVPAGTFTCQYVKSYDTNSLEDEWYFNKDNGLLIKHSTYDSHTAGPGVWEKQRTELVSFQR